jgi:hypothetical protein
MCISGKTGAKEVIFSEELSAQTINFVDNYRLQFSQPEE